MKGSVFRWLVVMVCALYLRPPQMENQAAAVVVSEEQPLQPVTPPKKSQKRDAKTVKTGKPEPPRDRELAQYGIFASDAPTAKKTEAAVTTFPLHLQKHHRIAFIGNTLLDRAQDFGHFESHLNMAHPQHELVIRNFAWSADEVDLQPRPKNFATVDQHLARERVDVIFAAFGFNESFAGVREIAAFKSRLERWLLDLQTSAFNGISGPQIVLISPIANENVEGVPAANLNNERLAVYTGAMAEIAAKLQVGFANVFDQTRAVMEDPGSDLTFNGVHLEDEGYRLFADVLFRQVFNRPAPEASDEMRAAIVEKNRQYFRRYRPLNTYYYTGSRNKNYGYLDFLPAMRNLEIMTANRDRRIWEIAQGKSFGPTPVDDSNVPVLDEVYESRGANEWMTPAQELDAFRIDPRFEVNLFASEEEFPEIACPIAMRWDARGRLWVSCSTTYPHVYPGQEPNDKIVILEDSDWDGKADRSTIWAEDLSIPLSFELYRDGIIVSEEPHLSYLRDTDGDGKADWRRKLLTGFGCEDSHHAIHDFVWSPDGDLIFRESIFHNSQIETPYGPIRASNSAWFRYSPENQGLVTFGSYPNTNPWGVTFSDWGHHVASHPIFASAFHATNPPYPGQHPKAANIPAYSGVCGHEFVDFPMWPEALQGGFIKVRYKPTNRVEIHRWIEGDDHFQEQYVSDLLFSQNLSFIPVDLRYGPRGAMYVCDWYNPVKGHAQYSLRDPRRDRTSGRIWRIVPKGAELQDPPKIAGASIEQLLDNLKRREYRYRYWSKRELRDKHSPSAVAAALDDWVSGLDSDQERFHHHQLEALWMYRSIGKSRPELLMELLNCDNHHARAAATRQLRYTRGAQGIPPIVGIGNNGLSLGQATQLLRPRADDENGIVRMEAVIAASYLGTPNALQAALLALNHPMGSHLSYALRSSLGSAALSRHWDNTDDLRLHHPELETFLREWAESPDKRGILMDRSAADSGFDNQENLFTIEISTIPERMLFTVDRFTVKAGQPVRLLLTNPDVTPHNLVIIQPGSNEAVGMAANEMAKDPSGEEKEFIPDHPAVLHHSGMLGENEAEVLRFHAPEIPDVYPYICTYPGHWVMMKGEMIVE